MSVASAEQFYNDCAISPYELHDMQTVILAPGVTLTRPGLVTPTMSRPTFRARGCAVRGEEHPPVSSPNVPMVTAACCVLRAVLQSLSSATRTPCRQWRSRATRSRPWRPRSRGATTSRCWRPQRLRLLSSAARSTRARGCVWRVHGCMHACPCPEAAASFSPRAEARTAVSVAARIRFEPRQVRPCAGRHCHALVLANAASRDDSRFITR